MKDKKRKKKKEEGDRERRIDVGKKKGWRDKNIKNRKKQERWKAKDRRKGLRRN